MDVLFVTPKIMDESLSASTRLGVIGALAHNTRLTLIARYRTRLDSPPGGFDVVAIHAPRIPVLNMLWFMLSAVRATLTVLRDDKPDVILIEPLAVWPVAIARFLARDETPVVLDMRTLPIEARGVRAKADVLIAKCALRKARSVCASYTAITPGVAAWASRLIDVPVSEIAVWGTGVDPTVFDPRLYPSRTNDEQTFELLYHGALYSSRGLESLVRAMTQLTGAPGEHTRLRIVGEGPDRAQLSALVDDLGIADTVSVEGPVPLDRIPETVASCDMGVIPLPDLPCWSTSSPTKLFELLAMETPVIVTSIEAHRLVLNDSGAVVWAGTGSSEDLALAISSAYDEREALKRAAQAEREGHMRLHSWSAQAGILFERLRAVAGV